MKDYSYLVGNKLDGREIIALSPKPYYVVGKCKCGDVCDIAVSNIQKGKWGLCKKCAGAKRQENVIGKRFGKLVVLSEYTRIVDGKIKYRLICKCDCGETADIDKDAKTKTKTCGCSRILFPDRERHQGIFVSWKCMMQRVYNPKHDNYMYYGAKGVIVHEPWKVFINFYNDTKDTWFAGATIDRFPLCNGNYMPNNYRWATDSQQVRNRSNSKFTEQDILDIRQSTLSRNELIKKYNSTAGAISRIITRSRWKTV